MTLTVRPATREDAAGIVPLMYESSRDLIDYSFRFPDFEPTELLRTDFLRGGGIFGYENQVVAVEDGVVVGTMTSYAGRRATELTLQTLRSALAQAGWWRLLSIVGRSVAIAALFIRPRADGVFLANACVANSHRGRGVFSRLFAFLVETRGAQVVELDVSFANDSAKKVYEHLGFRVTAERPYNGKRKVDGFRRMEWAASSR